MPNKTARSAPSRALSHLLSQARPIAVALAAALLGACTVGAADEPTAQVRDAAWQGFSGIPQQGDTLGAPSAPVTLVEFSDLRCSHCRDFVDHTLPVLVDRYVRQGRLRIVFNNLPILGPASVQAARMSAAVGLQGHQFEFIDAFFHRAPGPISDEVLRRIAGQVPGVDVAAAMAKRDSPEVDAALTDARTLAQRYAVHGTPTFLLGKTGAEPHDLPDARAAKPETLTGPIDDLLAQP